MLLTKPMRISLLALALAGVLTQANAATLPAPSIEALVEVRTTYGTQTNFSPISLNGPQIVVDYSSLAASASTKLSLTGWGGSASSTQSGSDYFTQPYSSVSYAFEVTGPKSTTLAKKTMVAVDFAGVISAHITAGGDALASSVFSVGDSYGNSYFLYEFCLGGCGASIIPNGPTHQYITTGTSIRKSFSMVGLIPTNEVLSINLSSDVYAYTGQASNASVALSKVQIDPSVVNPDQYKILKGKL